MNLITVKLLNDTKQYYEPKYYSIVHQTISLIISQQISFKKGREIRRDLFNLIQPNNEFTVTCISSISDESLINIGLTKNKIQTIRDVVLVPSDDIDHFIRSITSIRGIGCWTIKCLKIFFNLDVDIMLSEDFWVRQRMAELMDPAGRGSMSARQCDAESVVWQGFRTNVSKFLWRIKPHGIVALLSGETLIKEHFL